MKENVYNLFAYADSEKGIVHSIGCVKHHIGGGDQSKIKYLQKNVEQDLPKAKKFKPFKRMNFFWADENGKVGEGQDIPMNLFTHLPINQRNEFFENAFLAMDAPKNPLTCITAVIDGKIRIDGVRNYI